MPKKQEEAQSANRASSHFTISIDEDSLPRKVHGTPEGIRLGRLGLLGFRTWLLLQRGRNNPVGGLAYDLSYDPKAPVRDHPLLAYLLHRRRDVAARAYKAYRRARKSGLRKLEAIIPTVQ